jgi:hypothetical protein
MTWEDALEVEVRRSKHERWRVLTADDHPDHEQHRRKVVELATGIPSTEATYPGLFTMAGNALAAAGRVVVAVVQGQLVKVAPAVYYERLEICRGCEFNGEAPSGVRCMKCGCGGLKLELATERCPVGKWEAVQS